ncbi:MAG: RidA family protein [Bacteroidales bacterium]|nr:RidA family protein [Bacteroidales bacterium]MDD2612334.1 RidA family protein [Bacteroidales bacterium]MDD4713642.1 RidA family protein [Bacteroidales bacterium]
MKKVISTKNAPAAIGPYSQAIEVSNMIFVSGQIPVNPETGKIDSEDITGQTMQSFTNLRAVLAEAGCSIENVVKTTVFLADMSLFEGMNEVYKKQFTGNFPARSAVAVKALPKGSLVEIEAIAFK